MTQLLGWIASNAVNRIATAIVGVLLPGITWTWLRSSVEESVASGFAQLAVVLIAMVLLLMVPLALDWYPRWQAWERYPELRGKGQVRLGKIADTIGTYSSGRPRDEVLHSLLRALWLGHFERPWGKSRMTLDQPKGMRVDGLPTDGRGRVVANPPQRKWGRRQLLCVLPPISGVKLPSKKELTDNQISWRHLKKKIDFDVLASLPIRAYHPNFIAAYVEKILISQRDFRAWYMRYLAGYYDG